MGIADFPRELFRSRPKPKEEDSSSTVGKEGSASKDSLPISNISTQNLAASGTESPKVDKMPADSSVTSPSESINDKQSPDAQATPAVGSSQAPAELPGSPLPQPQTPRSSVFSEPTISTETDITRSSSLTSAKEPQSPSASTTRLLTPRPSNQNRQRSRSPSMLSNETTMERAVAAGESVERVITTGVKSPMNFCLGLAKGFRNIPKLYNDDTVRPVEKVNDLPSGIKVAGKEFALGFYDGISGLATQPLRGAEKEGAVGLVKGFGKGIGGLIVKPASGESPSSNSLEIKRLT